MFGRKRRRSASEEKAESVKYWEEPGRSRYDPIPHVTFSKDLAKLSRLADGYPNLVAERSWQI
jgi:hypothetical protein